MSSVIDSKKCPRCGYEMTTEFNCRTQEDYGFCAVCGCSYSYEFLRNPHTHRIIWKRDVYPFSENLGFIKINKNWSKTSDFKPFTGSETTDDLKKWQNESNYESEFSLNTFALIRPDETPLIINFAEKTIEEINGVKCLVNTHPIEKNRRCKGYGVVSYKEEKFNALYPLRNKITKKELDELASLYNEGKVNYVTHFNRRTQKVVCIAGTIPEMYREGYDD